ncbi:lysophospholipid acyltransferase family protein [Nocardia seriolae]|uniref:Acyl-phosphate glycerol 3-phosphate acyltransferase n=1 Tax=Nocardia seriolae TaxID=37332 RepID=A0A0B8NEX1_9NOCA|nr:lysophospholipid acyltransferase family protein [Nocardia seriolae]MTJ63046.1 1-acyl-sn-glycerol-3-phosphate acyltransferase [Nocardia seriolae]MTJ76002.1 1-acyl-sn-glycerol-3-phosphate acyltransferase [Nocardia seriolae]MTJ89145.1 1-acyl-sn-glycerol-3-phosphate acyltransferase [Nocardia seriolae]MTK33123.1 1-acyl-sn-glycerol-3-phosphate acyltransferase [Nocardia seriolae]MTK40940.1 1-acyl-sn-glycerol-3-phosphate acyltransferase [Nocardia seriolae]
MNTAPRRPKGLGKRAWLTTHLVRRILRTLASSNFVNVTVIGRELVPATGPVIVAGNHISMLDAVFLWGALRRRAIAIAMAELWSWPIVGRLVRRLGQIPVVRRDPESGRAATAAAEQILHHGGVLIIYPEGKLVAPGESEPYKPGVATLSLATGVPIIPVATTGTDGVLPTRRARGTGPRFNRRHPVTLRFGTPIDPTTFDNPEKLLDHLRHRIEDLRTQPN